MMMRDKSFGRPEEGREPITRNRECLLHLLAIVDVEGWDGPTARRLLEFVRVELARPLAVEVGLRGLAASQGEASAWQAAWVAMTRPSLRQTASPWGVVWRAAQRAALGEVMQARYGKDERRAWDVATAADVRPTPPISLDTLQASGWDAPDPAGAFDESDVGFVKITAAAALTAVGWSERQASEIIEAVCDLPNAASDPRSGALGWHRMATVLGVPPWQARRLCVALRGTTTWRGLFARIICEGESVVDSPAMLAALTSTRVRAYRSPVLASERAMGTQR